MSSLGIDGDLHRRTARTVLNGGFHLALAIFGIASAFTMLALSELASVLHELGHRLRH